MEHEKLLSDDPLKNPEEDLFGYAPYAKRLAEIIRKAPKDRSLVIALNGSWGTGKTTFLNFVVKYIENYPKKETPIIVKFNPWLFSGHGDLANQFFRELQAVLESKFGGKVKRLISNIADFAAIVSKAPELTGIIQVAGSFFLMMKERTTQKKELWELKAQISKELKNQNRKFLVLIDDIDRLSKEEIRDLFKLIKSIADFPNIHYLLAFDKNVVTNALGDTQDVSGEEYLSKIVQVALDLPIPDKIALRKLFLENINIVFAETPNELYDYNYFLNLYWDGIDHFLKTPRDVKRLINAIKINYPSVKGEVNPADFIAIETLRIFAHDLYCNIRSNPEMFCSGDSKIIDKNILRSFHQKLIEEFPEDDRKPLMNLLRRLFPMLEGIEGLYGNVHYGSDFIPKWRKELRVCVREIFPIYFRFSVPEGDMSNIEIKTLLALLDDIEAFGNKLIELSRQIRPDGYTRVSVFLERLLDFIDEIPTYRLKNLLKTLFNVGDNLLVPEDEPKGLFSWGNDIRIGRVFFRILRRYKTPQERFEILKEIFESGHAISVIVIEIIALGQQHGKYGASPDPDKLIDIEHLEMLEEIALRKIKEAANTGELLKAPALATILYRWRDWENEDAPRKWILNKNILASDKNLVAILTAFLTKTFSQNLDEVVPRINWRLNPKTLEPFLDPNAIIHRCRLILSNPPEWLTEKEKIAVETFVKEFDSLQGKNIDEIEDD
ncbi:MAG: AAA family ATPase [Thermosediminibacteraceae bacterium]|nr:AAA family ATPase [Thermosediminibacteraceae bacterium]